MTAWLCDIPTKSAVPFLGCGIREAILTRTLLHPDEMVGSSPAPSRRHSRFNIISAQARKKWIERLGKGKETELKKGKRRGRIH